MGYILTNSILKMKFNEEIRINKRVNKKSKDKGSVDWYYGISREEREMRLVGRLV